MKTDNELTIEEIALRIMCARLNNQGYLDRSRVEYFAREAINAAETFKEEIKRRHDGGGWAS